MPGRRHLWKGIHDPDVVKGGIRLEARNKGASENPAGTIEVAVKVTNAAVGHRFPSYVTPKVFVRAALKTSADWRARSASPSWPRCESKDGTKSADSA